MDKEKTEVRVLLYEYKDTFSSRDEIGICPNIVMYGIAGCVSKS